MQSFTQEDEDVADAEILQDENVVPLQEAARPRRR